MKCITDSSDPNEYGFYSCLLCKCSWPVSYQGKPECLYRTKEHPDSDKLRDRFQKPPNIEMLNAQSWKNWIAKKPSRKYQAKDILFKLKQTFENTL